MSAPAEMEPQGRSLTPPPVDGGGAEFDSSAIEEMAAMEMEEPQIDGEEEVMAELPAQDDPLTAHVTAGDTACVIVAGGRDAVSKDYFM